VRDAIEVVNSSSEYPKFIAAFMPALTAVLETTPAQLSDGPEHKLRNTTLEVLNRMPHTEALRPFDKQVLKLAMDALKAENEENALVCLRIIFDLHRNFRPNLESEVAPFLEFVCEVYKNIGDTVKEVFGDEGGAKPAKEAPAAVATPSTKSFKVMTECPLIVMLLFQLYSRLIPPNIQTLLPLMVQTIGLKGPSPDDVPTHLRAAFGDLKGSQVKMVSFVTYLLRGYAEAIQPHHEAISQSIVDLLRSCPDNVATRKELLVATRHVLSAQDFRRGFYTHLDALLDEDVLIGTGRACYDALRPLAYSFLAELVHHMRLELTLPQIRRTVYVFSRNVQDNSLPLSIQMTCVRLMHHLVESIFRRRNDPAQAQEARANLIRILDTTVSKFRTVRPQVKTLLDNAKSAESAEARAVKKAKEAADAEDDAALGIVVAPNPTQAAEGVVQAAGREGRGEEGNRQEGYAEQGQGPRAKIREGRRRQEGVRRREEGCRRRRMPRTIPTKISPSSRTAAASAHRPKPSSASRTPRRWSRRSSSA
jgi:transformation/transcription domain-associated protein